MYCTPNRPSDIAAALSSAWAPENWRSNTCCSFFSEPGADSAASSCGRRSSNGSSVSGQRVRPSRQACSSCGCKAGGTASRAKASRSLSCRCWVSRRTASAGLVAPAVPRRPVSEEDSGLQAARTAGSQRGQQQQQDGSVSHAAASRRGWRHLGHGPGTTASAGFQMWAASLSRRFLWERLQPRALSRHPERSEGSVFHAVA